MNVSLTPELVKLISEKVACGLYEAQRAGPEALRLLERDQDPVQLGADAQDGFDPLAANKGHVHDKASGRRLADRLKAAGRQERARTR